jgi:hypothetical protein
MRDGVSGIEVKNTGPAAARNVTTVVAMEQPDRAWSQIRDVGDLVVRAFPPGLHVSITSTTAELPDDLGRRNRYVSGKNAFEVSLGTLPPGGSFQMSFTLHPSLTLLTETGALTLTVQVAEAATSCKQEGFAGQLALAQDLGSFVEDQFAVTHLTSVSTCDNCEGSATYLTLPLSAFEMHVGSYDLGSDPGHISSAEFRVIYLTPSDQTWKPVRDINLQVTGCDETTHRFQLAQIP